MRSLVLTLLLLANVLHAQEARLPEPGECALFREGGGGYILTAPTYYVRGTITEVYRRPHRMDLCPNPGKSRMNYTREDWQRFADAFPCVNDPALARDVDAVRVRFRVEDWDTPWAVQHGRNGMLMKGRFLDTELQEGVELDIDGTLLLRCEE